MENGIAVGGVHHLRLTVRDPARSRDFYTSVLGLHVIAQFGPSFIVGNDRFFIGLGPAADPAQAPTDDRFNENRVGLDHVSFHVGSRAELDAAVRMFDERGIPHGEIVDLGDAFRLYILAFRDPDNIQLELTATYD